MCFSRRKTEWTDQLLTVISGDVAQGKTNKNMKSFIVEIAQCTNQDAQDVGENSDLQGNLKKNDVSAKSDKK